MFDLTGHVAIVTGASRGIGAAAARALAAHGAVVGVNCLPGDDSVAAAASVVEQIEAEGGRAIVLAADVTDERQVSEMVFRCAETFGPVTTLITNAADIRPCPWEDLGPSQWEAVMAVNATGTYLCVRAVWDGMVAAGGGSIVTVGSVTISLGVGGSAGYIASKGAVLGFTRAMARIGGPHGIRVNSVLPGAIRTEAVAELDPEPDGQLLAAQCIRRPGTAQDVAGAFLFLASDASSFVTGQALTVDGGLTHH